MLWKLLKYDVRSMWKQFAIIWPAALVIALINRFTLTGRFSTSQVGETTSGIMMSLYIAVMAAMFVVAMTFVLKRFYAGLLGDEGYLMHTLPVRAWQLVASKLICAVLVAVLNTIVAFLSMFLLAPVDWTELFHWRLWQMVFHGLMENPDTLLYLAEFCLLLLTGLVFVVTMAYLSMALGHLFQRRRVLMSVVAFFAIDIVCNVVLSVLNNLGLADFWRHVTSFSNHLYFWALMLFLLIPAGLFFAGTSYILGHRLNLE